MIGPPASPPLPSGVTLHEPNSAAVSLPESHWPEAVKHRARELGFTHVGIASAEPFSSAQPHFDAFLAEGRHGSMSYLAEGGPRTEPTLLLEGAKSLVVVALGYRGSGLCTLRTNKQAEPARIAAYAQGDDYHQLIKHKLRLLADACADVFGRTLHARACVDTAPLLEREAARRAGLGFVGKSCMSIVPGAGSYFLLGELVIDVELAPDRTLPDGCGRCTACLDACPTKAFSGPYTLDAARCIAYLTIEHRGVIPRALRGLIGTRVFGCDVCQDVCPYNQSAHKHPVSPALAPRSALGQIELVALLNLTAGGYRRLVRKSALGRATRRMLQRNAAVALGNSQDPKAAPALITALSDNPSALVRGHAAWALGRVAGAGGVQALGALEQAVQGDGDDWVRDEARAAIASVTDID